MRNLQSSTRIQVAQRLFLSHTRTPSCCESIHPSFSLSPLSLSHYLTLSSFSLSFSLSLSLSLLLSLSSSSLFFSLCPSRSLSQVVRCTSFKLMRIPRRREICLKNAQTENVHSRCLRCGERSLENCQWRRGRVHQQVDREMSF